MLANDLLRRSVAAAPTSHLQVFFIRDGMKFPDMVRWLCVVWSVGGV